MKYIGKVIFFSNKTNYGFISWDNGKDIFVHYSDIICDGFKTLNKDQLVEFELGYNHNNELKAINVYVIEKE